MNSRAIAYLGSVVIMYCCGVILADFFSLEYRLHVDLAVKCIDASHCKTRYLAAENFIKMFCSVRTYASTYKYLGQIEQIGSRRLHSESDIMLEKILAPVIHQRLK
jgi:hypothetical protein